MDLHKAILTRRTVHKFKEGAVPPEVVHRALEAAHFAPNHKLTFPWRFTLAGENARKTLGAIGVELKGKKAPLTPDAKLAIEKGFTTPGVLIAVSCVLSPDPARSKEDYAAVACAVQNMMLSFWDAGFGSKWGTGAVSKHPAAYEKLGIDPTKEEIIGFLYVGVPETVPPAPPRPPARDFIREVG